jgi:ThiF family
MTKAIELRIAASVWNAIVAYHLTAGKKKEALSYLFAEVDETDDVIRILVPHTAPLSLFDPDCFECQSGGHVRLHKDVLQGLLIGFTRSHYPCLINTHDHWFDTHPVFSRIDDADDQASDRYLRRGLEPALSRIEGAIARPVSNCSVVVGQEGAFARLIDTRLDNPFLPIARITIVGDQEKTIPLRQPLAPSEAPDARLDRHRDFITPRHQAALKNLQAVIVGAGGTGSILAEALGRTGIGGLTIIDGDCLEDTNLNRWQGGEPWMVGRLKALLLARRLAQLFPELDVRCLPVSVFDPAAEYYLREANVLFGAVDADAPRLFLNRLALQHLIPYFDVGTAVTRSMTAHSIFAAGCSRSIPAQAPALNAQALLFSTASGHGRSFSIRPRPSNGRTPVMCKGSRKR